MEEKKSMNVVGRKRKNGKIGKEEVKDKRKKGGSEEVIEENECEGRKEEKVHEGKVNE